MYLLIPPTNKRLTDNSVFTSQHVSINSLLPVTVLVAELAFTSQHVSINSKKSDKECDSDRNLHPNMYLLIPLALVSESSAADIYIPTCIY